MVLMIFLQFMHSLAIIACGLTCDSIGCQHILIHIILQSLFMECDFHYSYFIQLKNTYKKKIIFFTSGVELRR